jgi:two-component SAPR family response regulator
VLSRDKKYFYALCYPHEIAKTELKLYRFSLQDGSYTVVSAPIPVASMRIESDINLFFSEKTDQFLCAVQEFTDRRHSTIRLYSLGSPPVSTASYLAAMHPQTPPGVSPWFYTIPPVLLVSICLVCVVYWRKKKPVVPVEKEAETSTGLTPLINANPIQKNKNSVYLLGEFLVFDRKGNDITHLFSPKIKQLFVLILLNSREGKGVSSKKISAKLWPDKDIAKTKNIKGVTFNHLRNIISDIDGIELIFTNDSYTFTLQHPFFCDYSQLVELIRHGGSIWEHYPLIARGPLLEDLPESLLEDNKSVFEEQLLQMLLPELKRLYEVREYKAALEMAKLILGMDAFNEEALKYQLRSFRRLRGLEYSRKAYDQFTQDYQRSLGVAYHISFDKIVQ